MFAKWPSSLRARLTVWYTALLTLPLVLFAILGYIVFARTLVEHTDRFIGDALTAFSRELTAERRAASTVEQAVRTTVEEVRFRDLHIAMLDSAHRIIASTAPVDEPERASGRASRALEPRIVAALTAAAPDSSLAVSFADGQEPYRLVSRPFTVRGERFDLTGTYSLAGNRDMLAAIRRIFFIVIPLLVLFAATGGSVLAKRSLVPMSAMTARASAISASNLGERLPVAGGDELVMLATVVNGLLDRLQDSFEHQRRFMTDASHELRTPTSILRTETDVTLAREHRSEDEYRASVKVMQDAARRLTRIVDDLFLLARADAGQLIARNEPINLEDVVHDAARGISHLAQQRDVRVVLGDVLEAPCQGDADLLGRLFLNLLDNAIKHAPSGSTVDIGMARRNGHYEVAVIDEGAGIPSDAQLRVFDRFFRVDGTQTNDKAGTTYGAGLGLAIARRIADVHGGQLDLVESRPGRTEFRFTLAAPPST
jgi:heavy metal sensor kinase